MPVERARNAPERRLVVVRPRVRVVRIVGEGGGIVVGVCVE